VDSLNANPVEIQFADDRSGKTLKAMVDGDTMVGLFFQGLYITQAIPLMPKAIYSANNGVYNFLSAMLSIQLSQLDYISYGMYYSVQCSEEYPFDTPETVMAMLKQLPPQLVGFARRGLVDPIQFSVCQMWGTKPPAPIENQPVTSDVPTLVMSGEYDPITPPDYGKAAAATLKNSFFFQFPGLGHGTIPSDVCPRSIALAFVDNPTAKPDAACIASMREPSFSSG
jgi:pimeloyl-ACP methyl ester carboxylesterase